MSEISSLIGQQFAFASGRTGVLQQLLLTESDVDRLLGAHSGKEAEQILTELKMTNPIDQGLSKADEILHAVGAWVRKEVETMSPEATKPVFHILWLEEDAAILSYLLKVHFGLTSEMSREPLSGLTAYSPDALKALVLENQKGLLPEHVTEFVHTVKKGENQTPQEIDHAVSQFITDTQRRLSRTSGSAEIRKYVEHRIDMQNIRTALRLQGEDGDRLSHFLEGGSIKSKKFVGDINGIAQAIERSDLPFDLASAIRNSNDDLNALEQALNKVTADDIAHLWNVPLGIEQLFAFAAISMAQLKLLRALLIGKFNGLSPQEIKQMLPPFLSASHYVL